MNRLLLIDVHGGTIGSVSTMADRYLNHPSGLLYLTSYIKEQMPHWEVRILHTAVFIKPTEEVLAEVIPRI